MGDFKELEFKNVITPQIVYVDEQSRIMGITSEELGVEVITEINCSWTLTEDGFAKYKYINGEVVERTEEEIEADRLNVPTPEPSAEEVRFTEIEDALIEVSEMVVENETDTNALAVQIAEIQDALVELAEMITGE